MVKRLAIFFIIAIVFLSLPLSFSAKIRDLATQAISPIGSYLIRRNTFVFNTFQGLRQIPDLRADKEALQAEVLRLQQAVSTKESVHRENETLRKELGVTGVTREFKKVFAHVVLGAESGSLERTFVVDAGSSQGVRVGQAAIAQGALIGRVTSVREHSSVIRSILSSDSQVQAWIVSNREKGRVVGNGSSARLDDITQGIEVKPGDIVETSGLGGSLPQGILIGEVESTKSKKSELSQSFAIKLAQDPNQIESLFIVLTDTQ